MSNNKNSSTKKLKPLVAFEKGKVSIQPFSHQELLRMRQILNSRPRKPQNSQHRQQRTQKPKTKYIEKPKQSQTSLQAQNAINTQSVSAGYALGDMIGGSFPIHPNDFLLFPNLQGIWRSFQQYKMGTTHINCQPLASTLSSGAYSCTLIPSTQNTGNGTPNFASLINFATTSVSTIWKPMSYKFAHNILNRLNSYLMQSIDTSTSSPGTLIISKSSQASQNQQSNDQLPIFTLHSRIMLKDFVPANPQPSPSQLGIFGIYSYPDIISPGPMFLASKYTSLQSSLPLDFSVCTSTTSSNWFKVKQVGAITLVVTSTNAPTAVWSPADLVADGILLKPFAYQNAKLGCQYVYNFISNGNTLISCPGGSGYTTSSTVMPSSISFSIYRNQSQPSVSAICDRWKLHNKQFVQMLTEYRQIIRPSSTYHATKQYPINKQPTTLIQIEQGYCWVRALQYLGCKLIDYGNTLSISHNQYHTNTSNSAQITNTQFLRILSSLHLVQSFIQNCDIQVGQIGHIVCHPGQDVLSKLLSCKLLAGDWRYVLKIAGYKCTPGFKYDIWENQLYQIPVSRTKKFFSWQQIKQQFHIDPDFFQVSRSDPYAVKSVYSVGMCPFPARPLLSSDMI